jgi:hypothetical protein
VLYLASVSVLLCLLLLITALGRRVADFLPDPLKDPVAFYIGPLLGLATLVLITNLYGWLSPFRTDVSMLIASGLLSICILFEKQKYDLFVHWLIVSAFAIVATLPIFAPIIRFDSYNPFNDTFTYLVHGQWLQEHAFSHAAHASGFFPAETQVFLYQKAGHRMGGSFFLGFVQSLFHLEWSYFAYPATVAVVFTSGSLAIGAVIRQAIPVSRTVCFALCTLPAFSMNGFLFGAQYGFFPQTFGIAFAGGLACLVPGFAAYALRSTASWKTDFLHLLPLAICCSALLISYNDMFPVVGAAIGLFVVLVCSLYWSERNRIIRSLFILAFQVLALINMELVRLLRNLIETVFLAGSGAVHFGWPMYWSPIQFVAHSFGMKSPFQSDIFVIDRLISTWLFSLFLIMIVLIVTKILRDKPRNLTVLFLLCINIVIWLVFAKFRYTASGVHANEIGNTFLQFKLAKWAAPFNLGLLGIAIAWLSINMMTFRFVGKYAFLTAFAAGMSFQTGTVAKMFTRHLQDETMRKQSPFAVFLELRAKFANIPKDQVTYLAISQEHHKLTQMAAYVLSDRKLASKYEDGYLVKYIPATERDMPMEKADWLIQHEPTHANGEDPLSRVGPFLIRRAPFSFYSRESVAGAYATETSDNNSWNWVKESVEYRFRSLGKTSRARIRFQFLGNPRTLFVELKTYAGKRVASFEVEMKGGWSEYESPSVDISSEGRVEGLVILIRADGASACLSASDAREVRFLIQNLSLDSGS